MRLTRDLVAGVELEPVAASGLGSQALDPRTAFERLALSAAALHRVLRVARTLADLAGAERLGAAHVAEAVQHRAERSGW